MAGGSLRRAAAYGAAFAAAAAAPGVGLLAWAGFAEGWDSVPARIAGYLRLPAATEAWEARISPAAGMWQLVPALLAAAAICGFRGGRFPVRWLLLLGAAAACVVHFQLRGVPG